MAATDGEARELFARFVDLLEQGRPNSGVTETMRIIEEKTEGIAILERNMAAATRLIEEMAARLCRCDECGEDPACVCVEVDRFLQLAAQAPSGWIRCRELLPHPPENMDLYDVILGLDAPTSMTEVPLVHFAYFTHDRRWIDAHGDPVFVTHWRPRPRLPGV